MSLFLTLRCRRTDPRHHLLLLHEHLLLGGDNCLGLGLSLLELYRRSVLGGRAPWGLGDLVRVKLLLLSNLGSGILLHLEVSVKLLLVHRRLSVGKNAAYSLRLGVHLVGLLGRSILELEAKKLLLPMQIGLGVYLGVLVRKNLRLGDPMDRYGVLLQAWLMDRITDLVGQLWHVMHLLPLWVVA